MRYYPLFLVNMCLLFISVSAKSPWKWGRGTLNPPTIRCVSWGSGWHRSPRETDWWNWLMLWRVGGGSYMSPHSLLWFLMFCWCCSPTHQLSSLQSGMPWHRWLRPWTYGFSSCGRLRPGTLQGQPCGGKRKMISCFVIQKHIILHFSLCYLALFQIIKNK